MHQTTGAEDQAQLLAVVMDVLRSPHTTVVRQALHLAWPPPCRHMPGMPAY